MFDLPPPDPAIEIVVASQGVSKGLRQTQGIQIVVRPEAAAGPLFVGGYFKNVDSAAADGEAGFAAGFRRRLGGFDLAASATLKLAVGDSGGDRRAIELGLAASRRIGALTPRISLFWSPDDLGGTGRTLFLEAGTTVRLAPSLTLSGNVAIRDRTGGPDYRAFNAGISWQFTPEFSAELRYYDTDRSGLGEIFEPRLVAALRTRF